jgi:hypothetical protein
MDKSEPVSCDSSCLAPDAYILNFDEENGQLFVPVRSFCQSFDPCGGCTYSSTTRLTRFDGFTTTFEILQTYTPTPSEISFRVPYMPEGLPAADSFDTYYGDLATIGDWSKAKPLQCDYPAAPPSVGECLTVADTLPTPQPGHGYYYVTAVNYQGQRRYGRKSSGGVLSGRDPAVLPGCEE